jgi:metal iron transporter
MNYPSRNDDTTNHPDWNQSPPRLNADLTTRADLNGISNLRENHYGSDTMPSSEVQDGSIRSLEISSAADQSNGQEQKRHSGEKGPSTSTIPSEPIPPRQPGNAGATVSDYVLSRARKVIAIALKYVRFIGPGFMIAVAYIDPGNYATDVNGEKP